MNRTLVKLRSGKGASISFALLLFLVCAVLSSLIITAASSAAGRISGMAEADQKYYSVTSTCELLEDLFDGKMATIVTVGTTTKQTSLTEQEIENILENGTQYVIPDMDGGEAEENYAAKYVVVDNINNSPIAKTNILANAAYKYSNNTTSEQNVTTEDFPEGITPDVKETIGSDGSVSIIVSKNVSNRFKTDNNPFAMKIEFTANIDNETSTKIEEGTHYVIKTQTLKWSLKDMKVISATGAGA